MLYCNQFFLWPTKLKVVLHPVEFVLTANLGSWYCTSNSCTALHGVFGLFIKQILLTVKSTSYLCVSWNVQEVNTHTHINIQRGNLNRDSFFVVAFSGIRNHFILEKIRHIWMLLLGYGHLTPLSTFKLYHGGSTDVLKRLLKEMIWPVHRLHDTGMPLSFCFIRKKMLKSKHECDT
jgi:hypothetical protein